MNFEKLRGIIHAIQLAFSSLYVHYGCTKYTGWGHVGSGSKVLSPSVISNKQNIYLGDNVSIDWDNVIYATNAKLIVGDNSGIAVGCTFITGNHKPAVNELLKDGGNNNLQGKDIVLEEEVWVGAKSVVLAGSHIGRGAIIAAGSIVRGVKIPPYAIVAGNPCKVIGYRYTPEEIIQHEETLYPEDKRLPIAKIQKNYDKYFKNREKIVDFISLY